MSIALATKPAGNKRVLRPVNKHAAVVNVARGYFDRPIDEISVTYDYLSRTNLDGTVVTTARGRTHTLMVKITDHLPEDYVWQPADMSSYRRNHTTTRVDRYQYMRDLKGVPGVFLNLGITAESVDGAERMIAELEALTLSDDRTTLVIPAAKRLVIEQAEGLYRAAYAEVAKEGWGWYRGAYKTEYETATRLLAQEFSGRVALDVVRSAILATIDETEAQSPFTIQFVGREVDPQIARDAAHGEALALVAAERVEINARRYEITQEIAAKKIKLAKALERVVENARSIATQVEAMALDLDTAVALFNDRETRPTLDAVAGLHWDSTPERLAQDIAYLEREYKHLGAQSVRKIVLPGEED